MTLSSVMDGLIPFTVGLWLLIGKPLSKIFRPDFRKKEIILGIIGIIASVISLIGTLGSYASSPSLAFTNDTQKIKSLWAAGKYDELLSGANNLLVEAQTDSDRAIAHYWIGLAYFDLKNITQAEQEELLATRLDPKFDGPFVTLSAISLGENNCQQALDYAQTAVNLDYSWAWGHNDLGLAYICLGNHDKGVAELKKAVELDPNTTVFQDNLKRNSP